MQYECFARPPCQGHNCMRRLGTCTERSVHTRYSAVEGRIIRSMNRYLVNQIRGYGRFNHESLFKSHRASDPSGRLYEETERGFELWKEFLEVRKLMKKLKNPRIA